MPHRGKTEYWLDASVKDRRFEDYYDLGKELGRGATSVVHKCTGKNSDQAWAVKILDKRVERKAIMTESEILLKLDHPNIVRLKEIFESPDFVYMVLELVTGGELFERIEEQGFYSEVDAAHAVRNIIKAVQYLHENGIAHRDLKPENILCENLSKDSNLKLSDFGLSTIVSNKVQLVTVCGTPAYCAPEVLRGNKYGKICDMWSVGVIAYILLCGYEPFYDDNESLMYKRILKAEYQFDHQWWKDVSENAKDFVMKMLVVDPNKRLTPAAALKHVWVSGMATKTCNMECTLEKIKEFNARRKMKFAMDAMIAVAGTTLQMPSFLDLLTQSAEGGQQQDQVMDTN